MTIPSHTCKLAELDGPEKLTLKPPSERRDAWAPAIGQRSAKKYKRVLLREARFEEQDDMSSPSLTCHVAKLDGLEC